MSRFLHPITALLTSTLAAGVFAQSTPATNRTNPPAPPSASSPGVPAAPGPATPAGATPAAIQETPSTPLRELNFTEADVDGDRKISLTEFSTFVENRLETRSTGALSEQTIERFRQFDQDNDAFLSETEARATPPPASQQAVPPVPPRG